MNKSCRFKENDVDEIIPGLWLGNIRSAQDKNFLGKYNIKYIIRLVEEKPINKNNNIIYYHFSIKDVNMCNNLNKFFDITNKIIQDNIHKGNILVHCKQGHHRSGTVVAAYLIKRFNLEYKDAVFYINYIRKCALRRDTCMGYGLYEYYLYLKNKTCQNITCKDVNTYYLCSC